MDPKAAAAATAFMQAIMLLDLEYYELLQRMGCKSVTLHRF